MITKILFDFLLLFHTFGSLSSFALSVQQIQFPKIDQCFSACPQSLYYLYSNSIQLIYNIHKSVAHITYNSVSNRNPFLISITTLLYMVLITKSLYNYENYLLFIL